MAALEADGAGPAGQANVVGDVGDGADLGVLTLVARDEQHALGLAGVDGERDGHVREDDGVVQGDEQKLAQESFTFLCRSFAHSSFND